jgi:hypothetical protein
VPRDRRRRSRCCVRFCVLLCLAVAAVRGSVDDCGHRTQRHPAVCRDRWSDIFAGSVWARHAADSGVCHCYLCCAVLLFSFSCCLLSCSPSPLPLPSPPLPSPSLLSLVLRFPHSSLPSVLSSQLSAGGGCAESQADPSASCFNDEGGSNYIIQFNRNQGIVVSANVQGLIPPTEVLTKQT